MTRPNIPFDNGLPADEIKPVFASCKGWQQSLEGIENYDILPEALKKYFEQVEAYTGVPITMISTGPEREKLIMREVAVVA